jgi:hypothetical protein
MERENATNDRAFDAEVRDLPLGESAGPGGAYQVEISKVTGETRFAIDLDGVRYWLIVPPGGRIEDAIAEVQRRTRMARTPRLDAASVGLDAIATRIAKKLQGTFAPVVRHEVVVRGGPDQTPPGTGAAPPSDGARAQGKGATLSGTSNTKTVERRYLKQKDYATLRSVSVSTVKTWCRLGLPTNGVQGRGIRIKLAEAEAWLEAGGLELAMREAGARHARSRRPS